MRGNKTSPGILDPARAGGLWLMVALLGSGCSLDPAPGTIPEETFVEYYTVLLQAQEVAAGDRDTLLRQLDAADMPDGWREQMIEFVEKNPLTASRWSALISQAAAAAEEPVDG
jgi:hypothetical protein